jgi:uncharacterized protein
MKKILTGLLLLVAFNNINAQDCLLDQKPKQDFVQDYADVMTDAEEQTLRQALITFNDSVSNQILIVTVNDLCGYDKFTFTQTLGEKWGVGQKGKDNGVVIVIKPKEIDGKGEVEIQVGYGLEGVLPDAIAKRIVEKEMIPRFKKKDYYAGIANAATTIMEITGGEYTAEEYAKTKLSDILPFLAVIFIIIIVMMMKAKQTSSYAHTNGMSFWAAWALMNASSRSHGGSFGSFGSGGGGFGGFGGGSFGGGGAGGSW